MSEPVRPRCGACPYFHWMDEWTNSASPDPNEFDADDKGYCHRHAPASMTKREPFKAESVWPQVYRDDFCGEHPDFPAYLAELRPYASRPEEETGEEPKPRRPLS